MRNCKGEKLFQTNQSCLSLEQLGLIFGKVFRKRYEFSVAVTFFFRKKGKIVFFATIKINS